MSDSDLMSLYSARILALAANVPLAGRLPAPDASVTRRAPMCGSGITVDVVLDGGRVAAFAQDVRACALGQAAASVVGAAILGASRTEVEAARNALRLMLEGGPAPTGKWAAFEVLLPARDYRNRHASILLAIEAAAEAIAMAE